MTSEHIGRLKVNGRTEITLLFDRYPLRDMDFLPTYCLEFYCHKKYNIIQLERMVGFTGLQEIQNGIKENNKRPRIYLLGHSDRKYSRYFKKNDFSEIINILKSKGFEFNDKFKEIYEDLLIEAL